MSRWFPDRVAVRLTAPPPGGEGASSGAPLRAPLAQGLAALASSLDGLRLARRTRIDCVVGAPYVRYRIVPWNPAATSARQRHLFARHCFREAYGEPADHWRVSLDAPGYGRASIACATDAGLVEQLRSLADARGLVLAGMQPSLALAFNAMAVRPLPAVCAVVVRDDPLLTVLMMRRGEPLAVRVVAAGVAEIPRILEREWTMFGFEPTDCDVGIGDGDPHRTATPPVWTRHRLGACWGGRTAGRAVAVPEVHAA